MRGQPTHHIRRPVAMLRSGNTAYYWSNGTIRSWSAQGIVVAGEYAAYVAGPSAPVTLQHLPTGVTTTFGVRPYSLNLAVADDGTMVWGDNAGTLRQRTPAGVISTLTMLAPPPYLSQARRFVHANRLAKTGAR